MYWFIPIVCFADNITLHLPTSIVRTFARNGEQFIEWVETLLLEGEISLASHNMQHFQDVFDVLRKALAYLKAKKESLGTLGSFRVHLKGGREPWRLFNWYKVVVEVEIPHN
jgi:hypothetical protein